MITNIRNLVFAGLLLSYGCKKSQDVTPPEVQPPVDETVTEYTGVPYPESASFDCQYGPKYGDSIVYPQEPTSSDYFINPKNNKGLTGSYYSWPVGLSIDQHTGTINLTQSETGQRYHIAFVLNGGKDTCISSLILAGASYMDSIYTLSASNNSARPYFNADPFVPQPCQGPGCYFDWNNYAKNQGIVVNKSYGFIDLKATMKNEPFGHDPANGTTITTTIYYALNDNSNYAHQKIDLKLIYYNKKSDVPAALVAAIRDNEQNTMDNSLLSKGKVRPPLIVIVRSN